MKIVIVTHEKQVTLNPSPPNTWTSDKKPNSICFLLFSYLKRSVCFSELQTS